MKKASCRGILNSWLFLSQLKYRNDLIVGNRTRPLEPHSIITMIDGHGDNFTFILVRLPHEIKSLLE